jgi:hypothetical protein
MNAMKQTNIPWLKMNSSLSAVPAVTYNKFKTVKKRIDSGKWVGVSM